MIKGLVLAVVIAAPLSAPTLSFAQTGGPVTRAQVRNDISQIRKAGYDPQTDHVTYPDELQAAQRRVNAGQDGNASGSKIGATAQK